MIVIVVVFRVMMMVMVMFLHALQMLLLTGGVAKFFQQIHGDAARIAL